MTDYNRIIRECFWDLNITGEDIQNFLSGSDLRAKTFLFEKILTNSTKLLLDLQLFNKGVLKKIMENYEIKQFNRDYLFRRKNIAEAFFFNKPLEIDELKWQI